MSKQAPFERLSAYCIQHKLHFWTLVAEIQEAYFKDCFPAGNDLLKFRLRGGKTPARKVKIIKRTWLTFPWKSHNLTKEDAVNQAIAYFFETIERQDD